jgi:transposase
MGAPKKADWREERRKQAWDLKEQGWRQKDIARALGVSEGAVSQRLKRGRIGGMEALKAHPPKGVTLRLSADQKAQIPDLLAKGAEAYGFRGEVWTAGRTGFCRSGIDWLLASRSRPAARNPVGSGETATSEARLRLVAQTLGRRTHLCLDHPLPPLGS